MSSEPTQQQFTRDVFAKSIKFKNMEIRNGSVTLWSEPVDVTGMSEPVDATGMSEPVDATGMSEPVDATGMSEPVNSIKMRFEHQGEKEKIADRTCYKNMSVMANYEIERRAFSADELMNQNELKTSDDWDYKQKRRKADYLIVSPLPKSTLWENIGI